MRQILARLADRPLIPACGLLAICIVAGSGAAALAQDAEPKGMPQLDFGNPLLLAQVVWGAIIFAAFYVLCARWVLPMMGAVLETRQTSISADLHAAHLAKAHADAAVEDLVKARHSAQASARAALDTATQEAKSRAAAAALESNARLDAQLAAAEQQITQARTQAMGALREVATATASLIVTRLTGHAPADADVQAATDGIIGERALPA